jgi:hypothetical protein
MSGLQRKLVLAATGVALSGLLAGCTSDITLEDFNVARRATNYWNSQTLSYSAPTQNFTVRPVTQNDLVDQQGQCAAVGPGPGPSAANGESDPAEAALIRSGIALQMTECEVVSRVGAPDNVEFGTNQRGGREVVLTYMHGPRPGIYRFAGGRLNSIERGPEPEPPAEKPKKGAPKKKRQATVTTTVE